MTNTQYIESAYTESNLKNMGVFGFNDQKPDEGIFRNMLLSWSLLPQKTSGDNDVPCWFLFADVLRIDTEMLIDTETVIFARRIEVTAEAGIILDTMDDSDFDLMIFCQEVVVKGTNNKGLLKIKRINEDESIDTHFFSPNASVNGATGFFWHGKSNTKIENYETSNIEYTYMYDGEPLRLSLMSLFQFATLISTENMELAQSQFRWISSIAATSNATLDLATQASASAMNLEAMKAAGPNALIVPMLDLDIYAEDAKAFMQLFQQRQVYWQSYELRTHMDQQWADSAQTELALADNELDLDIRLERQAHNTYNQVSKARDIASQQVSSVLAEVVVKRFAFEAGIKIWERDKTIEGIFKIAAGLAEILIQIPAIVVAGPQLATMPIMETIDAGIKIGLDGIDASRDIFKSKPNKPVEIEMVDLSEKPIKEAPKGKTEKEKKAEKLAKDTAAKNQEKLKGSLKKAGSGAKKIFDAAMNIAKISASADAMHASSENILSTSQGTVNASFADFSVQGLDVVTGGAQDWDNLALELDDSFESISELKNINGGTAYQLELRKLIIVGKTLSMAKLAMAKAATDLATARMIRVSKAKSVVILNKRLKNLTEQVKLDDSITQLIFNRVLDAKRSVYMALETYRRAYQYFTLAQENALPILPKITGTFSDFSRAVAEISSKKLQTTALGQGGAPPQTMKEVKFNFNDAKLVQDLRDHGITTFHIGTDNTYFNGFGRVRFNRVRIFVDGLEKNLDTRIKVDIATAGEYADKAPQSLLYMKRFIGMQTLKTFVYNSTTESVSIDGDIAARYENDFFNPTPFTIWTIRISRQDGQELDLSKVTGIRLLLEGEATPQISYRRKKSIDKF